MKSELEIGRGSGGWAGKVGEKTGGIVNSGFRATIGVEGSQWVGNIRGSHG